MRPHLYIIGILLIIITGCSHNGVPDMPNFTTEEQKICGQKCLAIHSRCSAACDDMFGDVKAEKQRETCQDNCNSVLGDCYETCR